MAVDTAAVAGGGGISRGGPTPWWQLPEYNDPIKGSARTNLEQQAPEGYRYDPVQMQYVRTPASKGSDVAAFLGAVTPGATSAMQGLAGAFGGGGGTAGVAGAAGTTPAGAGVPLTGGVGGGISGGSQIAKPSLPDFSASNAAAYATAKDQVGKTARSALTGLNDYLSSQGMLGSGAQVQGARDIIQSGEGQLGQVSRDLAQQNAAAAQNLAALGYTGGITQRGQDINAQEAQARLAQSANETAARLGLEREQLNWQQQNAAAQRQMQMIQMALSGLGSLGSLY